MHLKQAANRSLLIASSALSPWHEELARLLVAAHAYTLKAFPQDECQRWR